MISFYVVSILFSCRGQCYDGAGSMAGKTKGAQAIIAGKYPKALYMHCKSHILNLCVVKSCGNQVVSLITNN